MARLQVYTTSCSRPLPVCRNRPFLSVPRLILFYPKDIFADTYHFKTGVGGLAYLGLGFGFMAATMFGARTADHIYKYVSAQSITNAFLNLPRFLSLAWGQKRWSRYTGNADSSIIFWIHLCSYWSLVNSSSTFNNLSPDHSFSFCV